MGLSRSSWGEMEVARKPPGGELRKESGIPEAKSGNALGKKSKPRYARTWEKRHYYLGNLSLKALAALAIK